MITTKYIVNGVKNFISIGTLTGRVRFKLLNESAIVPTNGSERAAGYDLYSNGVPKEGIVIEPGKTKLIGTGIVMALPHGTFGGIYARSGLACKNGIRPANCVGVIDSDYRGEIKVALYNDSDEKFIIHNGERIAQLICQPYIKMKLLKVDNLNETKRGAGGFGSTGNN